MTCRVAVDIGGTFTDFCIFDETTLTASGAVSYEWSPTDGLTPDTGATVVADPLSSTNYTVIGTDANGCQSTASVTVTVNPLPDVVPSATPQTIDIVLNLFMRFINFRNTVSLSS